jgi:carboxypeptidase C (cathepsin A)
MRKKFALITSLSVFGCLLVLASVSAQEAPPQSHKRMVPVDTEVGTKHSVKINGEKISYTASTGTQPVWDEKSSPIASLFYTYYERQDVDILGFIGKSDSKSQPTEYKLK